jgi:hypothetical protein
MGDGQVIPIASERFRCPETPYSTLIGLVGKKVVFMKSKDIWIYHEV